MKMVKSLPLGLAAGVAAVTAGQAAELPVKAQPVQYVKVCSLYGAGFYYMPGTDTCIKIGGYVRVESVYGDNGNVVSSPFNANLNDRSTSNLAVRARGYITADAREMTAYGVARGFLAVGTANADVGTAAGEGSNTFSSNRAFLQWAGFTSGLAISFYDFYFPQPYQYRGFLPESDTSDNGWMVPLAYTAQFGGGITATLAAEMRRTSQIIAQTSTDAVTGTATLTSGATTVGGQYGGFQVPDMVFNLRADETWGAAQLMGALHQLNAQYYAAPTVVETNGHPADTWAYAIGAGLKVLFPAFGPGDSFATQLDYTVGDPKYHAQGTGFNYLMERGASQSFGIQADCIYGGSVAAGNATSCIRTTSAGFNAAYDHFYSNHWHQSLYVEAHNMQYNAQANAILCSLEGGGNGAGVGTGAVATAGCNNNWIHEGIGSRLQWDVTDRLYIGLELDFEHMISATTFNGLVPTPVALAAPGVPISVANENNYAVTLRLHKDFYEGPSQARGTAGP